MPYRKKMKSFKQWNCSNLGTQYDSTNFQDCGARMSYRWIGPTSFVEVNGHHLDQAYSEVFSVHILEQISKD